MSTDQEDLTTIRQRYSDTDLMKINQLRQYYRRNFQHGASDDRFKTWLEDGLLVLNAASIKRAFSHKEG